MNSNFIMEYIIYIIIKTKMECIGGQGFDVLILTFIIEAINTINGSALVIASQ